MDKKPEECKSGAPEWMVTYGDLVTLLMCFFVLLFAFSEIDAQKFEAVMQSFQGSAGVLESGKSLSEDQLVFDASPENDTTPETTDSEPLEVVEEMLQTAISDALNEAKDELEKEFQGKEFEADIEIEIVENKLIIRLKNNVLFDSARADIKEEALPILAIIGEVLNGELFTESEIKIEGHTDNVPINTVQFPSNWQLSAGRATSVLNYFVAQLDFKQERLSIAGHAEFRPIDTNETPEGRANNRRVEIIIEKLNFTPEVESEETNE
jgi:chemotaxis protein MotB